MKQLDSDIDIQAVLDEMIQAERQRTRLMLDEIVQAERQKIQAVLDEIKAGDRSNTT